MAEGDQRHWRKSKKAHLTQAEFLTSSVGLLVNHLTYAEWNRWQEANLIYLANLRTFDGAFLGLLYEINEIKEKQADIYNLLMWRHAQYYIVANEAYQLMRPRLLED